MKVIFPDGPREIEPVEWQASFKGLPPTPVFEIPGYFVVKTMAGEYLAVRSEEP